MVAFEVFVRVKLKARSIYCFLILADQAIESRLGVLSLLFQKNIEPFNSELPLVMLNLFLESDGYIN